jgi:hypothetical protein
MHDTERECIFGEWLAGHKGILFKVVHSYAFEHADCQDDVPVHRTACLPDCVRTVSDTL